MGWPKKSISLRTAVAHILAAVPGLHNTFCTFDQLAGPVNIVGGCVGLDGYATVDGEMIKGAFKKGVSDYTETYHNMNLGYERGGEEIVDKLLACRIGLRGHGRQTKTNEIGCFISKDPDKPKLPQPGTAALATNPLINQPSFRHELVVKIPDTVKQNLVEFLRDEFGPQQNREAKKATAAAKQEEDKKKAAEANKKKAAEEEAEAERKRRRKSSSQSQSSQSSQTATQQSSSKTPSKKQRKGSNSKAATNNGERERRASIITPRDKPRANPGNRLDSARPTLEEFALQKQFQALKDVCVEKAKEAMEIKRMMNEMTRERNPNVKEPTADPSSLHYILDNGRVGQVDVDTTESPIIFIHEFAFENALLDLPPGKRDANSAKTRASRRMLPAKYGASQCWTPTSTVLVGKDHLTRLEKY